MHHVKRVPAVTARREGASERGAEFGGRSASLRDHREAAVAVRINVHIAASGEELDRAARGIPRVGVEVVVPPCHISRRFAAVRDHVQFAVRNVEAGLRITVAVILKRSRRVVVERGTRVIRDRVGVRVDLYHLEPDAVCKGTRALRCGVSVLVVGDGRNVNCVIAVEEDIRGTAARRLRVDALIDGLKTGRGDLDDVVRCDTVVPVGMSVVRLTGRVRDIRGVRAVRRADDPRLVTAVCADARARKEGVAVPVDKLGNVRDVDARFSDQDADVFGRRILSRCVRR